MASEIVTPNRIDLKILRLPFLVIAIGITMALITLFYTFLTYANLYHNYSEGFNFILSIFYILFTPIIVLGVALLLLMLTESTKRRATWSKMIFFYGAFLFVLSSVFTIAWQFEIFYNENWGFDSDLMEYLGLGSSVSSILGTVLCALAITFLVKAYLSGEIHAKHSYHP